MTLPIAAMAVDWQRYRVHRIRGIVRRAHGTDATIADDDADIAQRREMILPKSHGKCVQVLLRDAATAAVCASTVAVDMDQFLMGAQGNLAQLQAYLHFYHGDRVDDGAAAADKAATTDKATAPGKWPASMMGAVALRTAAPDERLRQLLATFSAYDDKTRADGTKMDDAPALIQRPAGLACTLDVGLGYCIMHLSNRNSPHAITQTRTVWTCCSASGFCWGGIRASTLCRQRLANVHTCISSH